MAIEYSPNDQRLVDRSSGEYLVSSLFDRDEHEYYHIIYDGNDTPIFGSLVRRARVPETDKRPGEIVARFELKHAWIPTGRKEPPSYFNDSHPMVDTLARFLEASLAIGGKKNPEPRFEFRDERAAQIRDTA
jgi:hypothetical protein